MPRVYLHTLPCGHTFHEACLLSIPRGGSDMLSMLCAALHEPEQPIIDNHLLQQIHKVHGCCPLCRAADLELLPVRSGHLICNLGLMNKELGNATRAIELLKLASEGGYIRATYHLARAHERNGNVAKAAELFEIASKSGHYRAIVDLRQLREREERREKRIQLLNVASRDGDAKAAFELAQLHELNGDLKKAEELYEVASLRSPNYRVFQFWFYEKHGNFETATEICMNHLGGIRIARGIRTPSPASPRLPGKSHLS